MLWLRKDERQFFVQLKKNNTRAASNTKLPCFLILPLQFHTVSQGQRRCRRSKTTTLGCNASVCCICNQHRHAMIGHDEFILHIRVLKFCLYTIGCTKATKKLPRQEQRSHHRRLSVQEQGSRGGLWPFSIKNR